MKSTNSPASISPETVSQIGAGALLLTVAAVELWLAFWAAGWWHRGGASLVAAVGAVLVGRALVAIAPPRRVRPARHAWRRESPLPLRAPAPPIVLAEPAQR